MFQIYFQKGEFLVASVDVFSKLVPVFNVFIGAILGFSLGFLADFIRKRNRTKEQANFLKLNVVHLNKLIEKQKENFGETIDNLKKESFQDVDFKFTLSLKTDVLTKTLTYPEILNIFRLYSFKSNEFIIFTSDIDCLNSIVELYKTRTIKFIEIYNEINRVVIDNKTKLLNRYGLLRSKKIDNYSKDLKLYNKWRDLHINWKTIENKDDPYTFYNLYVNPLRISIYSNRTTDLEIEIYDILENYHLEINKYTILRKKFVEIIKKFSEDIINVQNNFEKIIKKIP